jgi:hypothetical protein
MLHDQENEAALFDPHDFELLLEARRCAGRAERSLWEFAVELDDLQRAGLSKSQLRWLICRGHVEMRRETTRLQDQARRFARHGNLQFSGSCCFVLTEAGERFAETTLRRRNLGQHRRHAASHERGAGTMAVPICPRWDPALRELWWGDRLVKRFRVPSPNQELVLTAWEEDRWPVHLPDPLPVKAGINAKCRLQDTIKRLNRHQVHRLLRFAGDGSGHRIRWERRVESVEF